jgi:hypothetical protein
MVSTTRAQMRQAARDRNKRIRLLTKSDSDRLLCRFCSEINPVFLYAETIYTTKATRSNDGMNLAYHMRDGPACIAWQA